MTKAVRELDSTQRLLLSGLLLCGQTESAKFTNDFMRILAIRPGSPLREKCAPALSGLIQGGLVSVSGNTLRASLPFSAQLELAKANEFIPFYQYYDELISSDSAYPGVAEFRALLHCETLFGNIENTERIFTRANAILSKSRAALWTDVGRELFRRGLPEPNLIRKDFLPPLFPEITLRCIYFGAAPRPWLKAGLSVFPKVSVYQIDCALLAFYAGDLSALVSFNGTIAEKLSHSLAAMIRDQSYEAATGLFEFINEFERKKGNLPDTLYATAIPVCGKKYPAACQRWTREIQSKAPSFIAKELSELLTIFYKLKTSAYEPENEFLNPEKTHCAFTRMLSLSILSELKRKVSEETLNKSALIANKLIAAGALTVGNKLLDAAAEISPEGSPIRSQREKLADFQPNPVEQIEVPKWKSSLDLLASLQKKDSGVSADPGYLSWHISASGNETLKIADIIIQHHKSTSDDPIKTGRRIWPENLRSPEFDLQLNARTKRIREQIKRDFNGKWVIEPAALKFLAGTENVFVNGKRTILSPGKMRLISKRENDGAFTLSFPDPGTGIFLLKDGENYRIVELTEEENTLRKVFSNCGNGMTVPKEAENELAGVLSGLTDKVDIQGEIPEELQKKLPVRYLSPVPAVRITRHADDLLSFELRITNTAGAASVSIPGEGFSSCITDGIMIRRDFSEERVCAEQTLKNIPAFGQCRKTGPFAYESETPAVSLSVLAQLQDSGIYTEFINLKRISIVPPAATQLSFDEDDEKWLDVGGNITLNEDKILLLGELLGMFGTNNGPFVKINENKFIRLQGELQQQLELLKNGEVLPNGRVRLPLTALPAAAEMIGTAQLTEKLKVRLEKFTEAFHSDFPVPPAFNGELRPYQLEGYTYLRRMALCGTGCCLADDMGLGKTVQLLAFLLSMAKDGPSLVVAPASVCGNWAAETQKFTHDLHILRPDKGNREKIICGAGPNDLVIASYGIITSEQKLFAEHQWNVVVIDEAQAIKNQSSQRTKAIKMLKAHTRIAATGTPVENKLSELWSLFDFLTPGLLGNENDFAGKFTENGMPVPGLKKLVAPLILRRLKKEVLQELPEKSEIVQTIELSENERNIYESIRRDFKEKLSRAQGNRIEILAALMKLRRFCCHPSLVFDNPPPGGAKLERVMELAEIIRTAGHRALIFSQFVDFLSLIRKGFDEKGYEYSYLDGSTPAQSRTALVEEFQKGNTPFFLISLKAGGTGLNLTAADYVIITDPWWNPAVEDQAADRAYRIGQTKDVTVYRLITSDTVEEKVIRLHEKKRELAGDILDNTSGGNVTQQDLLDIFD